MRLAATVVPFALASVCAFASTRAIAQIRFEEVSRTAGIIHKSQTYGAAWGDFNGDGWPDLWVGNHNSKPSLYLNNRDGTFTDVIDRVWSGDPDADTHGAAWADFDNDGDQDLVELVAAKRNADGTWCAGCGKNHLFVNENGKLVEKAEALGLAVSGQASTPLWLDADNDGKLDLLVVNTRLSGQPPSTIFRQAGGHFERANAALGFRDARWSRRDKFFGRLYNALRFKFGAIPLLNTRHLLENAQLADLVGELEPGLVLFSSPTRVYSIAQTPFKDVTARVGFPRLETIPGRSTINDAAVADFDGDGKFDMYLTRGSFLPSGVVQSSPNEVKATLTTWYRGRQDPLGISFRTEGELTVQAYPTWLSLSQIFIGSSGRHPTTRSFRVSRQDAEMRGPAATDRRRDSVRIGFDPGSQTWTLTITGQGFVDAIIDSTRKISDLKALGFEQNKEHPVDALLLRRGDRFVVHGLTDKGAAGTSCSSVAAGDFDNDMDVDLYLVCTGPVENAPNRLLENDGKGNFRLVPDAGGAAGSRFGRGDAVAVADYDRDGFLDLFVTNGHDPTSPFSNDGPHQLFHNRGNGNHWLEIDLEGVRSNRDGIGAIVTLEAGGIKQIREQGGGMHRIAQNYQRIHFGLGKYKTADRLVIRWPSGTVQELRHVAANQILRVRESSGASQ